MPCVPIFSSVAFGPLFSSNILCSLDFYRAVEHVTTGIVQISHVDFNLCGPLEDPKLRVGPCTDTTSVCDFSYVNYALVVRDYGDFSSQVLQAASENGELTYVNVTYSSAKPCPAAPSAPFKTTIQIICDYNTQFEIIPAAPPVDVVHTGLCLALIQAASVHACPLNKDLCKFTLQTSPTQSAVYELSSLATSRLSVYEAYGTPNTTFNSSLVFFNICAPVLLPFLTSGDCDSDTAACLVSTVNTRPASSGIRSVRTIPLPPSVSSGAGNVEKSELGFERLGLESSLTVEKHPGGVGAGIVLTYRDGSRCGSETYTLRLQLNCEPSCHPPDLCLKHQSGGGEFTLSNPPCGFLIIAGSSAACPTIIGGNSSSWNLVSVVILAIVVGGFMLYCSGGSVMNLLRGRRGTSVIPNHDTWEQLFLYVKTGSVEVVQFFWTLLWCCQKPTVRHTPGDSAASLGEGGSGDPPGGLYGTL